MTTKTTKLIRSIYLYLAALISLIFVAVGSGRILNIGLKYFIFPEAEKKSYFECSQQPPISPVISKEGTTEDQKVQIDALLKDYDNWKENQSGDKCIVPARQNNFIDSLTMVIIALPILLIHWNFIKKEKEEKETEIA
ncbi:MAG: hypothetical protein COX29_01380 [Candidatus Moranbacteria bacterium CG23_combo_of_CG06-09_8_20_14_all_35_22]|nr:MAG: hypothetical protein COX29_01380 [Candidatus Moranbacteria bacterium CG23_combo_of_CG06-09_8_20_14_all_35_22]